MYAACSINIQFKTRYAKHTRKGVFGGEKNPNLRKAYSAQEDSVPDGLYFEISLFRVHKLCHSCAAGRDSRAGVGILKRGGGRGAELSAAERAEVLPFSKV